MPLNSIHSHHLQSEPRQTREIPRRERGAETLHHSYKWNSILPVTNPQLPSDLFYLLEIHREIDHNEMLQRRLAHSTKILRDPEHIAMGEGNALAPQAVFVPLPRFCPMPLFHRSTGGNSAPASALAPLGGVCGRPRLRCVRYIFSALF
jgi:hypothetical protein